MKIKNLIPLVLAAGILGISFMGTLAWSQPKPGEKINLIVEEMTALEEAFRTIIDTVVLGDMQMVKPALTGVYEARERVEKALKAGQTITLPKNQSQFREFVELDDQFHDDLERLAKAAETGRKEVVKNYIHKLLDSCVVCHEKFRK